MLVLNENLSVLSCFEVSNLSSDECLKFIKLRSSGTNGSGHSIQIVVDTIIEIKSRQKNLKYC